MPVDDKERGILVPEWRKPEPELEFTRDQRKRNMYARKNPLRVMPKDKCQSVHENPSTHSAVLRVHPDAVEVGTLMGSGGAAYLGFFGVFTLVFTILMLYGAYEFMRSIAFISALCIFMAVPFFLSSMWMIRRSFFSPFDHPVLLNRKTGEVYVIPIKPLSFFRFWEKGVAGEVKRYLWGNVTARTYRRLDAPGGTVARTETVLQLLCSTSQQPSVVDEMVLLGSGGGWSDDYQVSLWEHIRRYMEEDGPPLQPGDKLRKINLDKVPEFPPEVVAAAGGPPLSEAELAQWTQVAAAP